MLEREAFTRGNMFFGNTMLNNGRFNLNPNLDAIHYNLPDIKDYNDMNDKTNHDEYNYKYGSSFLDNKINNEINNKK